MNNELTKKIDRALQYINNFAPKTEPYYVCYSGGKDSDCIRLLCNMWGGEYELHNNHTTVDYPETVYYVRRIMDLYGAITETYIDKTDGRKVTKYGERGFIHYPTKTMWQLIEEKLVPPTRVLRYCCVQLKELGGNGRRKMTGVRWDESIRRKEQQGLVTIIGKPKHTKTIIEGYGAPYKQTKSGGIILNTDNDESRRVVESCYRTTSTLVNPIIDWTDEDVWEFLHSQGCESNPVYKTRGYKRVGCVGCPLAGSKNMKREFLDYPKYEKIYTQTFDRMLATRLERGIPTDKWKTGADVMKWWVGDDPNQITIEDYLNSIEED